MSLILIFKYIQSLLNLFVFHKFHNCINTILNYCGSPFHTCYHNSSACKMFWSFRLSVASALRYKMTQPSSVKVMGHCPVKKYLGPLGVLSKCLKVGTHESFTIKWFKSLQCKYIYPLSKKVKLKCSQVNFKTFPLATQSVVIAFWYHQPVDIYHQYCYSG